jgi:hypothetical protein
MTFRGISAFAINIETASGPPSWKPSGVETIGPSEIVCAERIPRPLETRLAELQKLGPSWDSYGAVQPSHAAVSAAARLLTMIVAHTGADDPRLETLHVGPTSGGVHFEWDVREKTLEASINSSGIVCWTRISPNDEDAVSVGVSPTIVQAELCWLLG